jgi:GntR family transcriptional regulator, transcriptional repressor for pyruvate dehydrogenase complex
MARRQSLSVEVAEDIKNNIHSGKLQPGTRLATESEFCEKYEVSRTVVREAIASLRSEGLVIPRQGIGVFVSAQKAARRFEVDWGSIQSLPETVALLELRLAVEVEAAGLCARRRTKAEARSIRQRMEKAELQLRRSENPRYHYDFDFHLAIAKATRNPHFYQLLQFLRPIIVPRVKLSAFEEDKPRKDRRRTIEEEHGHESIVAAIEARDEARARESMRAHLFNSLERLRALAACHSVQGRPRHGTVIERALHSFVKSIASGTES